MSEGLRERKSYRDATHLKKIKCILEIGKGGVREGVKGGRYLASSR